MCVCVYKCNIKYTHAYTLHMHMYMCVCRYVVITHFMRCLRCAVLPYGVARHHQLLPLSGNTTRTHSAKDTLQT